ncbi:MAG: bifunctional isocitrate dehydrogenase kinase/phosphatase, partial [Candidatus Omnitrophota bacterium]|nr:bifunctional isocitrate dehydrogenase kinase/phosphatase [Candidatus Omnitrophota bacterium]
MYETLNGQGFGNEKIYAVREEDLTSVANGILAQRWPVLNEAEKKRAEKEVLAELGLMPADDHTVIIGSVARIDDQKNTKMLIRVISQILDGTDGGIRFIYVGDGHPDDPYTVETKALMRILEQRWPDRVKFIHQADHTITNRVMDGLQVFVYASKFEPFGTKPAAAVQKGVPLVLTRVGGLAEFGREFDVETLEGNAIFLKGKTEEDLYDALYKMINLYIVHPAWVTKIRENARHTDVRWEPSVRKAIRIYQSVVGDRLNSESTERVLPHSGSPLSDATRDEVEAQYGQRDIEAFRAIFKDSALSSRLIDGEELTTAQTDDVRNRLEAIAPEVRGPPLVVRVIVTTRRPALTVDGIQYTATSNINERVVYVHPSFFKLPAAIQEEILYHETISHLVKGLGEKQALLDTQTRMQSYQAILLDKDLLILDSSAVVAWQEPKKKDWKGPAGFIGAALILAGIGYALFNNGIGFDAGDKKNIISITSTLSTLAATLDFGASTKAAKNRLRKALQTLYEKRGSWNKVIRHLRAHRQPIKTNRFYAILGQLKLIVRQDPSKITNKQFMVDFEQAAGFSRRKLRSHYGWSAATWKSEIKRRKLDRRLQQLAVARIKEIAKEENGSLNAVGKRLGHKWKAMKAVVKETKTARFFHRTKGKQPQRRARGESRRADLERALTATHGNVPDAAVAMSISGSYVYALISRLGIDVNDFRATPVRRGRKPGQSSRPRSADQSVGRGGASHLDALAARLQAAAREVEKANSDKNGNNGKNRRSRDGNPQPTPFGPTPEARSEFDQAISGQHRHGSKTYVLESGRPATFLDGGLILSAEEEDVLADIIAHSTYLSQAPPVEQLEAIEVTAAWHRTQGRLMASDRPVLIIHLFGIWKLIQLKQSGNTTAYEAFRDFLADVNIDLHEKLHLTGEDEGQEAIAEQKTAMFLSQNSSALEVTVCVLRAPEIYGTEVNDSRTAFKGSLERILTSGGQQVRVGDENIPPQEAERVSSIGRLSYEERLARAVAKIIFRSFVNYHQNLSVNALRSEMTFEISNWRILDSIYRERFSLQEDQLNRITRRARYVLQENVTNRSLWLKIAYYYALSVSNENKQSKSAEDYLKMIIRYFMVDISFSEDILRLLRLRNNRGNGNSNDLIYRSYSPSSNLPSVIEEVLKGTKLKLRVPYKNLSESVNFIVAAIEKIIPSVELMDRIDMLKPLFYRYQEVYLVGRILTKKGYKPLVIHLSNSSEGLIVLRAITKEEDVSAIFSYRESDFYIDDLAHEEEIFVFLKTIMPRKSSHGLLAALGRYYSAQIAIIDKQLEFYQARKEKFKFAQGARGHVMIVFTMESSDVVLKVVKDKPDDKPFRTKADVLLKYRFFHHVDSRGLLLDPLEFENVRLSRSMFEEELPNELLIRASEDVYLDGNDVIVRRMYAQRKVTPLDVVIEKLLAEYNEYEREGDRLNAHLTHEKIGDLFVQYFVVIEKLLRLNIFPGDFKIKNYGVTQYGSVVYYDPDDVDLLTNMEIRDWPYDPDEQLLIPVILLQEILTPGVEDPRIFYPKAFEWPTDWLGIPRALEQLFRLKTRGLAYPEFYRAIQKEVALKVRYTTAFPYDELNSSNSPNSTDRDIAAHPEAFPRNEPVAKPGQGPQGGTGIYARPQIMRIIWKAMRRGLVRLADNDVWTKYYVANQHVRHYLEDLVHRGLITGPPEINEIHVLYTHGVTFGAYLMDSKLFTEIDYLETHSLEEIILHESIESVSTHSLAVALTAPILRQLNNNQSDSQTVFAAIDIQRDVHGPVFQHINGLMLVPILDTLNRSEAFDVFGTPQTPRRVSVRDVAGYIKKTHRGRLLDVEENLGNVNGVFVSLNLQGYVRLTPQGKDTLIELTSLGWAVVSIVKAGYISDFAQAIRHTKNYNNYLRRGPPVTHGNETYNADEALMEFKRLLVRVRQFTLLVKRLKEENLGNIDRLAEIILEELDSSLTQDLLGVITPLVNTFPSRSLINIDEWQRALVQLHTHLIGSLMSPVMMALGMPVFDQQGDKTVIAAKSFFQLFRNGILDIKDLDGNVNHRWVLAAFDLLETQGLVEIFGMRVQLTGLGKIFIKRIASYGVTNAYLPTYAVLEDVLTDNPDPLGIDRDQHIDRDQDTFGAGRSHEPYLGKFDPKTGEITSPGLHAVDRLQFNDTPLDQQPLGYVNIGAGDSHINEVRLDYILNDTQRGKRLREHPLIIGISDYNEKSLRRSKATLERFRNVEGLYIIYLPGDVTKGLEFKSAFDAQLHQLPVRRLNLLTSDWQAMIMSSYNLAKFMVTMEFIPHEMSLNV